jgi:hypothetical protein
LSSLPGYVCTYLRSLARFNDVDHPKLSPYLPLQFRLLIEFDVAIRLFLSVWTTLFYFLSPFHFSLDHEAHVVFVPSG